MKAHLLHCGEISVSPSLPYGNRRRLGALGLFTRASRRLRLPVGALLIEHPDGNILVDAGWSRAIAPDFTPDKRAAINHVGRLAYRMKRGYVDRGCSIGEQLANFGLTPEEIDYLLVSRLEPDHISGLSEVSAAKEILCSEPEMQGAEKFAHRCFGCRPELWRDYPLHTFRFSLTGVGPMGQSYDMFGDRSVQLVRLPGNGKGMFATLLTGADGRYLLYYSDAGYGERSWRDLVIPGTCSDRKAARASLEWIRTMSTDRRCLASFACHDPEVDPQTWTLP